MEPAPPDLSGQFALVHASDAEQLTRVLEDAAAEGFRVACASPEPAKGRLVWYAGGLAVLLEKSRDPGPAHHYQVVSMPPGSLPPRRWHEVPGVPGAMGFRFVPALAIRDDSLDPFFGGSRPRFMWVLDQATTEPRRFEYRTDMVPDPDALYRQIAAGEAEGFQFAALLGLPGQLMLVMERGPGGDSARVAAPPADRFAYFETESDATLRDRVRKAAAEGYRLKDGSLDSFRDRARAVLLERAATGAAPYAYEFPPGKNRPQVERELNEAGARGFRLHRRSFALGLLACEKAPGATKTYSYRVLTPVDERGLLAGLSAAVAEGYAIVGMKHPGLVILEMSGRPTTR